MVRVTLSPGALERTAATNASGLSITRSSSLVTTTPPARPAVAAARAPRVRELRERLAEVESLYLDRLMATHDANEGLAAFLAKRAPRWEHC